MKAAIQNGADSVYFGGALFNARASASNFDHDMLKKAIDYAKLRDVKTHFTLNILLKNEELEQAISLAKSVYEYGIDAIIVQDLGLATYLIKHFPDLPIHASTQMTIHNLQGALAAQKLGFKRIVLSRELPLREIQYICSNSAIEIETFIHGALCISYSGQCLFSSMVGGRSGNRGRCAQPCRMKYDLLEQTSSDKSFHSIDHGYLLSPKDLYGLTYLPSLIQAGVDCFKIEGRMKSPEYVGTVTNIYRDYINKAQELLEQKGEEHSISEEEFFIQPQDKKTLLQVFNRGGFSTGHLSNSPNRELIDKEKANHMGLYLGNISYYQASKGYLTLSLHEDLVLGDTIMVEKENTKYTISELMIKQKNIPSANAGQTVQIGRMKGNISIGDKVYKIASKQLDMQSRETYLKEIKKIPLNCTITIQQHTPITMQITSATSNSDSNYTGLNITVNSNIFPVAATNHPITVDRVITQLSKTNNTPYCFENIKVYLGDHLFVPSISMLNALRREALAKVEEYVLQKIKRVSNNCYHLSAPSPLPNHTSKQISVLLTTLHTDMDYTLLQGLDHLYIPLKYFADPNYSKLLEKICHQFSTYIYMPIIVKPNYINLLNTHIVQTLDNYAIKGFVVSNIASMELIKHYGKDFSFVANYAMNASNYLTVTQLSQMGINKVTLSAELSKQDILSISSRKPSSLPMEFICYGRIPVMNSNYCLLGVTNKCYPTCQMRCKNKENNYYLKDRMGYLFRVLPDNVQTVTTIYNSKITSLPTKDLPVDSVRLDFLEETISEMNTIIQIVKSGQQLEGNDYTYGNFYKAFF